MNKIGKYILSILILIILVGINFANSSHYQTKKIRRVTIIRADFDFMSFKRINCEEFDNLLNRQSVTFELNKKQIKQFVPIYESLKPSNENRKIDVRAKILVMSRKNNIDTICVGQFSIIKNGIEYQNSDILIDFIKSLD